MNQDHSGWKKSLKVDPIPHPQFGEEHKRRIRARIGKKNLRLPRYRQPLAIVCASAVVVMLGLGLWYGQGLMDRLASPAHEGPRQEYYEGEELLLQVFPDGTLKAGMEYGYIFHFAKLGKSPQEIVGKEMSVDVVHLETGQLISAVPPYVIEETALAGLDFERYIVQCALPFGGLWRYEVKLDGKRYANAVLDVGEPDWTPGGTFQSGSYEMTGIEGKIGFINPGFIAGMSNKYMWHIWGAPSKLDGTFEVMAVKQGTKEMIPVIKGLRFGGPLNGADGAVPSGMMLPEPGMWRLLPYVDGRLMESIVVEVQ